VASAVSDLAQAIGGVFGGLLGGEDGASTPFQGLIGRVASVMGDLAQPLGEALSGLLGGGGIPAPADYYHLAAQPLAAFHYDYEQASSGLIERSAGAAAAAAGELAQTAGRALGGGGVAPNQEAGGGLPATPPLVPVAPPVAPGGYSSSFLVGSGSGAEAFPLLFAILVVFSVALWRGGRLSWLRRESHGPPTAFTLAIERPG
jgi:hypothetical protein